MSGPADSEHEWFRRRLPEHLLDLLVDADRRRFENHSRSCAACARLLASALGARADWWEGAGHPTVGALLAWNGEAKPSRAGDPVRDHLAGCEACRRDLADLRGEEAVSAITPGPAPSIARRARQGVPLRWGSAAAAVATLVVVAATLVLWPREGGRAPEPEPGPARPAAGTAPEPGPGSPDGSARPATGPVTGPGRVAGPVAIAATDRGAGGGATRIDIAPGVAAVSLTLPPLFVPDGAALDVELRDAAGALVSRQALAADRALRPGGVVLPAGELAGGPHTLRVRWNDPVTGETSREFSLDVRFSR